jgi:rRNA maturation protein Rpf1
MLVTTSRDPSAKARRFGRALASFLALPYVNRGKSSLDESQIWLIVVEDHGNPSGLVKRFQGTEELLAFKLISDPDAGRMKQTKAVVTGVREDALPVARFFELEWQEEAKADQVRILAVTSKQMDFIDRGVASFRLKR